MINFKLSIILGIILERIRNNLDKIEEFHLGIFINSLNYSDEKSGAKEKNNYINSLKPAIAEVNKEVKQFNFFIRYGFGMKHRLCKLPSVNFSDIKKIVKKHKGDYPQNKSNGFTDIRETFGETDSASSLARKHTALQIRNVLMPLRLKIGEFVKSLQLLEEPYKEYDQKKTNYERKFLMK